jgi:hypothetical protein
MKNFRGFFWGRFIYLPVGRLQNLSNFFHKLGGAIRNTSAVISEFPNETKSSQQSINFCSQQDQNRQQH